MRYSDKDIKNMSTKDFIKKILNKTDDNSITETRQIVTFDDSNSYRVSFKYQAVLADNPLFGLNSNYTITKDIIDDITFIDYSDAEYYVKNAKYPSIKLHNNNSDIKFRNEMIFKDNIQREFNKNDLVFEYCYCENGNHVFGINGTNDFDSLYLHSVIDKIKRKFHISDSDEYKVIKSYTISDLIANKENDIKKLKASLEDLSDDMMPILKDEIERTKEYLDFLVKLAKC